jgi:hypothetical protein
LTARFADFKAQSNKPYLCENGHSPLLRPTQQHFRMAYKHVKLDDARPFFSEVRQAAAAFETPISAARNSWHSRMLATGGPEHSRSAAAVKSPPFVVPGTRCSRGRLRASVVVTVCRDESDAVVSFTSPIDVAGALLRRKNEKMKRLVA